MPKAVGVDIVSVERVRVAMERTEGFAERILTETEITQMKSRKNHAGFLAKRFAAKEAAVKALGTGIGNGVGWHQMEVTNNDAGAPQLALSGAALEKMHSLGASRCLLSLSDEKDAAVAFVILS